MGDTIYYVLAVLAVFVFANQLYEKIMSDSWEHAREDAIRRYDIENLYHNDQYSLRDHTKEDK